jgi:8-hydroxy-5-deazaflavin:NADPH oxidoreductase
MKIAIIGSGNVGMKLAALFHASGQDLVIGTRNHGKHRTHLPITTIDEACEVAQVVIFAIPYLAYEKVLPSLQHVLAGKIVIDASNPLNVDWSPIVFAPESSAGEHVALLLPKSHIVKAFNMVFADVMTRDKLRRDGQLATVFVASDFAAATSATLRIATDAGFAAIDAGPLRNARYLESMAHLNISLAVAGKGGTDAAFIYHRSLPSASV